jgi:hypothetical protein
MVTPSLVALSLFFAAPVDVAPSPVSADMKTVAVRPKAAPAKNVFSPTARGVCLKLASCGCAPQKTLRACVPHLEGEAAQRRATMPRGLEAMLEGMGMDAPQGPHALSWDQTVEASCEQACAAWGVPLKRRVGLEQRPPHRRAAVLAPAPRPVRPNNAKQAPVDAARPRAR